MMHICPDLAYQGLLVSVLVLVLLPVLIPVSVLVLVLVHVLLVRVHMASDIEQSAYSLPGSI